MELIFKLLVAVPMIWCVREILIVDRAINYGRLSRFLYETRQVLWLYVALRLICAIVEWILGLQTGYFSLASTILFFVMLALVIRFRRQRLINDWKSIPPDGSDIYNDIYKTLETVKTENNIPTK